MKKKKGKEMYLFKREILESDNNEERLENTLIHILLIYGQI